MRRLIRPLVAALAMAGGLVVLGPPAAAPAADGTRVQMVDNEPDLTNWHFDPAEVTVPAGATVVWLNKGKEEHTVTADDRSFDSGMKRYRRHLPAGLPQAGEVRLSLRPPSVDEGDRAGHRNGDRRRCAGRHRGHGPPVSTTATTAPTAAKFPASLAAPTQRGAAAAETDNLDVGGDHDVGPAGVG